jgi:KDO2-lipid IV(A) lauroyltransferase
MSKRKKIRRKIRYSLVYRLVQFLIFISNAIPRKSWLKFCGFLGTIAYYLVKNTRRRVRKHLAFAFPEKSPGEIHALSKNVFEMLGKNAGEMLRATRVRTL